VSSPSTPKSVVLPLLLPDAPVVTWWPGKAPDVPANDPLGQLGQRRVTDAAESENPLETLKVRAKGYTPGDTDLAWTRLTTWRTMLAATLDAPYDPITGARVVAEVGSPSAELLALWLGERLGVEIERASSDGPGITGVTLRTRVATSRWTGPTACWRHCRARGGRTGRSRCSAAGSPS
jgi:glucose-6-phosphate dehydrogenase assembly protein OpcA